MSLLHKSGGECLLSSLELFTVPPTQASIDKAQFVKYYPFDVSGKRADRV